MGYAVDPTDEPGASMTPWTAAEVARLRRAYAKTPSALAIWRSGAEEPYNPFMTDDELSGSAMPRWLSAFAECVLKGCGGSS